MACETIVSEANNTREILSGIILNKETLFSTTINKEIISSVINVETISTLMNDKETISSSLNEDTITSVLKDC